MKKQYDFINTFFDDVTECNRYATREYSIFTTYHGAIKHYYKNRKEIEKSNDCMSITPCFNIKKITLLLHHDFYYEVWETGSNETKTYYNFIKAFLFLIQSNIKLIYCFIKLAIKHKKFNSWELFKMMYKRLKIVL